MNLLPIAAYQLPLVSPRRSTSVVENGSQKKWRVWLARTALTWVLLGPCGRPLRSTLACARCCHALDFLQADGPWNSGCYLVDAGHAGVPAGAYDSAKQRCKESAAAPVALVSVVLEVAPQAALWLRSRVYVLGQWMAKAPRDHTDEPQHHQQLVRVMGPSSDLKMAGPRILDQLATFISLVYLTYVEFFKDPVYHPNSDLNFFLAL